MANNIEYALMAGAAYKSTRHDDNKIPKPDGWTPLDQASGLDYRRDDNAGFEAAAFQRGNEIVIAYAGTYDKSLVDMAADAALAGGSMDPQLFDAAKYYQDIRRAYPNASISLTGHSLGGGLAALIGVFFDQTAVTFDPAPFRAAASATNALSLLASLPASGSGPDPALSSFVYRFMFNAVTLNPAIPGENQIQNYAVRGEALSVPPWTTFSRIGPTPQFIDSNSPGVGGWDLHSIALLTAFNQSEALRQVTYTLPFLTQNLFDKNLFAHDSDTSDADLLTHLIRREFGVPGVAGSDTDLLTRFAADAMKLGAFGAAPDALKRPLLTMAMQHYYQTVTGPARDFFTTVDGGLRFDLTKVGDTSTPFGDLKGSQGLSGWLFANAPAGASAEMATYLAGGSRRFTLALGGTINANAPVDDVADFMFSGSNGGRLAGGAGNDLIVGRGSADLLNGGAGNDILIGGVGSDTYVWTTGDGDDRIIDTDKKGRILVDGEEVGALGKQNDGSWRSSDGKLTLSHGNSWTLGMQGGGSLDLGSSFSSGDFGLHLHEEAIAAPTSRTITGTAQADSLDDRIDGGAISNDLIQGLGGNDAIATFFGGDDRVEGGEGDDWLTGADGNDVYLGGAGRDVLVEGAGNDSLYADGVVTVTAALAAENATPSGLQGEALSGGFGDDLAIGGIGNDVLLGGTGDDILVAGAGDDTLEGDAAAGNIQSDWSVTRSVSTNNGVTSYERFYNQFSMHWPTEGGADAIYAGAGADWVMAGFGNDYVDGGNDADVLFGEGGNDDLFGGSGNDVIIGDTASLPLAAHGDDYLDGEDGDDSLFAGGGQDQLFGGSGVDRLFGESGDDYVDGEDGDDVLVGGEGADQVFGGLGNDFLQGDAGSGVGDGADTLDGEAGDDTLLGLGGADTLSGGEGNDQIAGDNGGTDTSGAADTIDGGAGNDFIDGQGGDDVIDAGADNDLVAGGLGNDRIAGGTGYDQLQGGEGGDLLDGGDDADTLFGEAGNDTLLGGAGNDLLIGGLGDDLLDGGEGDDVYYYSRGEGRDRIVDSGGNDWLVFNDLTWGQLTLGVGSLKLNLPDGGEIHLDDFDADNPYAAGGIEYLQFADGAVMSKNQLIDALGIAPIGTPEADVLSGTALSETIDALAGDDVVTARAGDDTIQAGDGADAVYAGAGNDLVHGGSGDDVLLGEAGNDTLLGEAGNDLLAGGAGTDALQGGEGDDTYLFQRGDGEDSASDALGSNAIALGAGLTLDAIGFSRAGGDLLVATKDSTDRLTVKDWYAADSHFVSVTLGDGTVLDHAGVEAAMPRNQAPLAAADSATVREDGVIVVAGNALANDSDPEGRALRVTNPGSYAGAVGTLSLDGDGAYSYSLANASSAVQSLAAGQSLTESFAYTVTDDDPNGAATAESSIDVTVQGTNDLPVLGADSAATSEDAAPIGGKLLTNDSDVDAGTTLTIADPGTRVGAYGTLDLAADGAWSYSLANTSNVVQALAAGQTATENFTHAVSDGIAQVGGTLAIGIAGRNDAPIIASALADQSVAANTSWSWQLPAGSFTDIDAGDVLGYGATLADGSALPSWLSFSAATQTFSGRVPKSASGSIDIRVSATDLAGASAADVFTLAFASGGGGGGGGGSGGGGSQGNEGVGNGVDAPPPGHDISFNDGAGSGPGNPGAQGGIGGGNGYRPPGRADIVMSELRIAAPIVAEQGPAAAHGNSAAAHAAAPGQIRQAASGTEALAAPAGSGGAQAAVSPTPTIAPTAATPADNGAPDYGLAAWLNALTTLPDHPRAANSSGPSDPFAVAKAWGRVDAALAAHLLAAPDEALGTAAHAGQSQPFLATTDDPLALLAANASLQQFKGLKEGFGKIA